MADEAIRKYRHSIYGAVALSGEGNLGPEWELVEDDDEDLIGGKEKTDGKSGGTRGRGGKPGPKPDSK